MNIYKIVISVIILSVFSYQSVYSVGGISNTKIVVPSTGTVPKEKFEFEPFFELSLTDDSEDSREFEAGARFTDSIRDVLEIGVNVFYLTIEDSDSSSSDTNFGDIEVGLKYRFLENSALSIAYQGGITFPTSSGDTDWVFEPVGFILTKNFSDKFSLDAHSVLEIEEDNKWNVTNGAGIGYFINDTIQPVVEIGYIYENIDDLQNTHVLNVTGGLTADVTDYLTIILGATQDIVSENTQNSLTFNAAFTFLF